MGKVSLLLLVVVFSFAYALLVPSFENPDETYHYFAAETVEEVDLSFSGDGNLYYAYHGVLIEWLNLERAYETLDENPEFDYFDNDYRYEHDRLLPSFPLFVHRIGNLLLFIPLFWGLIRTKEGTDILALLTCFPGFIWFLTAINSDVISVATAFLLYLVRKSSILSVLVLGAGYVFLDRTFSLVIIAYSAASIIHFVGRRMNGVITLAGVLAFGASLLLANSYIRPIFLMENTPFEVFRSVFTVSVSFYGLLGNMSIRAFLLEYGVFFGLLAGTFWTITKEIARPSDKFGELHFAGLVFVCYCIVWAYIMSFAPVLDQGRYFYLIAPFVGLVMFKTVRSVFPKIGWKRLTLIGMFTNSFMLGQLFYSYVKHIYI